MPLFIGDYLADTTRLTTEQHGAYLLLIMDYWRNGPPPDDDAVLSNITRSSNSNWKKMRAAIAGFFNVSDGKWVHSRIDREIEEAKAGKLKAQEKAAKAAEARWGKHTSRNAHTNAPSIAQALHEECPSPSPSPSHSKLPRSKAETQRATRLPADWSMTAEDAEFCTTARPDLNVLETAARFRDYWHGVAGTKGKKLDWSATWRNWVRNEKQQARASPAYQSKQDKAAEWLAKATGKSNDEHHIIDIN
jgi:uncharacterized protein YdaU (DUF1376 family)